MFTLVPLYYTNFPQLLKKYLDTFTPLWREDLPSQLQTMSDTESIDDLDRIAQLKDQCLRTCHC
jgi:hypothetical protein